ncbi:ATP-binding protein [Methanolobus sp. WCC4]|uniref:ATP-binding protein n=1 Tax=Methanolobus sp. WCC4 TaxID=3125784 RepID=UPI0030F7AA1A
MENSIHDTLSFVSEEYNRSLDAQSVNLGKEIDWILLTGKYEEGLTEKDPQKLLLTYHSQYDRLNSVYKITHFYFHDENRVNILRLHSPEKSGGIIERFTILEAERTGESSSGVELGTLGTFTLRTVEPIYNNGTLIGYIELGKEIEDVLESISYRSGAEIAVFIYKDELDQDGWEHGMEMLGRDGDQEHYSWEHYHDQVLIYSTSDLPAEVDDLIHDPLALNEKSMQHLHSKVRTDSKVWSATSFPLNDVSGSEVGFMLVMEDITDETNILTTSLKLIIGFSLLIFGILFVFYYYILDKTDREILANEKKILNSEEKFRNIFEGAIEGISVSDIDTGRFKHVNSSFCNMLGYTEEELTEMRTHDIHPDTDLRSILSKQWLVTEDESILLSNIPCFRKDGSTMYVDLSIFNANIDGRKSIVGFYTDITVLKKIDNEVRNANLARLAAEEANRVKSEFLANMSHELRTPLNSIIGFSSMLDTETFGELNEKQSRYVKNINASGNHLLKIINDILDISRVEAGEMELHYEDVDIVSLFDEVKDTLIPQASEKNIMLEYGVDEHVSSIYADKLKIKQILYNLVNNAIKFTSSGGKVNFDAAIRGDRICVSVTDTGIGISEDDQRELFKPFRQLDSFSIKEHGGTGLGLFLVKKFVELHKGEVLVTSELGKGSVFTFCIPLEKTVILK